MGQERVVNRGEEELHRPKSGLLVSWGEGEVWEQRDGG